MTPKKPELKPTFTMAARRISIGDGCYKIPKYSGGGGRE